MQTKKQSLVEAVSNTALGFVTALALGAPFTAIILEGREFTWGLWLAQTVWMTAVSVARGYIVRRYFNKR